MEQKKIFIVAGEVSGDTHAAHLVKELKKINPHLCLKGLGGSQMKNEGVEIFFDLPRLAVVGFIEVFKNLPLFKKIFHDFIQKCVKEKPDAIILVDYPGFNLRLAKKLKEKGFKIIYYISPQIWAWGRKRIELIKKNVDKMIVFFDFEKELYQNEGVNVDFVGHPLLDQVKTTLEKNEFLKKFSLTGTHPIIGLLPGSRNNEVKKILPIMLSSAQKIYRGFPSSQFLILRSDNVEESIYNNSTKDLSIPFKIISNQHHNAISNCNLVLAASGTATLETAILGIPLIIVYKVNLLTWCFAKAVVKIPYIGLVNVVANKEIAPELIQFRARPNLIALEANKILSDPQRYARIKADLSEIKKHLGTPGASSRAAKTIISFLS